MVAGDCIFFGVMRPGWDVEGGEYAEDVEDAEDHCFYKTASGALRRDSDWEGRASAREGDRIGMLLDLDRGSMTVWKNDVKLGDMVGEGLTGPLCWAVSCDIYDSARIESAPASVAAH